MRRTQKPLVSIAVAALEASDSVQEVELLQKQNARFQRVHSTSFKSSGMSLVMQSLSSKMKNKNQQLYPHRNNNSNNNLQPQLQIMTTIIHYHYFCWNTYLRLHDCIDWKKIWLYWIFIALQWQEINLWHVWRLKWHTIEYNRVK